jgi:glycosyltransferase involved in cell wall biosynthesis
MTPVLVSIIIPTYNRADILGRSILSVLDQSYRPIEVIVVDDGSTDHTMEMLAPFGDRIRVVRQENRGPSAARNAGVAQAEGEIIAFLDSDDTWEPEKLERQVRLLQQGGNDVVCCVCNAALISEAGVAQTSFGVANVLSHLEEGYWTNPAIILASRFILFNQVVAVRKEAFERIGGFKEHMRLLEDHDLAFRLSLLGPWAFVSDPLVRKYDDLDGVGCQAMRSPLIHARAWDQAFKGYLLESLSSRKDVMNTVRRMSRNATMEIRGVELSESNQGASRAVGRMILTALKVREAIWRRSSWPRVNAVPALVS